MHQHIGVDVVSRDVPTPVLLCINIQCSVPVRVRVCVDRTFELCERIGGTR